MAFELKRGITGGADVVDRCGALWRRPKAWRFAGRTKKVCGAPGFGANTGALGSALIAVKAFGRKMQVHARIRS